MILHLVSIFRHLLPKNISAITLWPFIFFKNKENKTNRRLCNHERIHLRQQIELFVVPFYIIYLAEYFYLLIKLKNHDSAYRRISFEKEAYENDFDLDYLKNRKVWAMWFRK
jgi:hypothetical protein